MAEGDTVLNAVIGAVVTTVVAFVPLSPLFGGAVAGYLQAGEQSDAVRVGALAGLLAAVPLVLVLVLLASVIPFLPAFGLAGSLSALVGIAIFLGFLFLLAYTVGLSSLGGVLGRYVARETDVDR